MTTADPPPVGETPLDELCRSAARLVHTGPTPPRRLRLRRGDLLVDIEWERDPAELVGLAPAPRSPAGPVSDDESGPAERDSYLRAPMVGTFYRAPEPGADPFVGIGDVVEPGQHVAILESMKLMNPVEADCSGTVVEILVADGASVEYDQPLLRVQRHVA